MRTIRLIGVAVLGAVGALGCSGMDAAGPVEETESVSQALASIDDLPSAYGALDAVSCVYDDKILYAGGFTSVNGAAKSTVAIYDVSTTDWEGASQGIEQLPTALGGGSMILIPGTDKCLWAGGRADRDDTTPVSDKTMIYDFSDDSWTVTGELARIETQLAVCGTGSGTGAVTPAKIIAVGGRNGNTYYDQVRVYDANAGTWSDLVDIGTVRSGVSLASPSNSTVKFLIGGGHDGTSPINTLTTLLVANDCTSPQVGAGDANLPAARYFPVSFPHGQSDSFIVTAGENGSGGEEETYKIVVESSWDPTSTGTSTDIDLTVTTHGTAMGTGRSKPALVKLGSQYVVMGGALSDKYQAWLIDMSPNWETEVDFGTARTAAAFATVGNLSYIIGGTTDGTNPVDTALSIP